MPRPLYLVERVPTLIVWKVQVDPTVDRDPTEKIKIFPLLGIEPLSFSQ
jgi:hypothetical protein